MRAEHHHQIGIGMGLREPPVGVPGRVARVDKAGVGTDEPAPPAPLGGGSLRVPIDSLPAGALAARIPRVGEMSGTLHQKSSTSSS